MGLEIRTSRLPELLKLRTSILSFQHNLGAGGVRAKAHALDERRSKLPIRSSPATGLPLLGVIGGNFGGNSP